MERPQPMTMQGERLDALVAGAAADSRDALRQVLETGSGREAQASRRWTRRRDGLAASLAATVLSLGGFGAVIAAAHPGDAMYGLHTMLFGEPPSVHDDRIVLDAKTELDT